MIAILVPVLARPLRAAELVRSIEENTEVPHRVLFLCSPDDSEQLAASRQTGAIVVVVDWRPGAGDFARKINLGFELTPEDEFVQIGADDLVFHPGWDTEALRVASVTGAGVIGTNDLHNPNVLRHSSSTHPFVRRAYIDEWGGTFDDSGRVLCELYDHQYVDDELVQTAIVRGQWAFAESSIVEHLHPYQGNAEMDSTYKKALRGTIADRTLYRRRMRVMRRRARWRRLVEGLRVR
jgi:hypothetical protein